MTAITLRSGHLHAEVLPSVGGGLARLDWMGREVLRAAVPDATSPGQLACFPLVPWSNRMDPAGFVCDGHRVTPAANRDGEPCPVHGDGWQQAWQVKDQQSDAVSLVLDRRDAHPFSYEARMDYALVQDSLRVTLEVRNTGTVRLPFGLGLHPWLPRPEDARLYAVADTVWLSGADRLPSSLVPVPQDWNFNLARGMPPGGVDNVFCGWNGEATISWPASKLTLRISADMAYYILYAPPGRDFFCFEPVDHAINAHNLPGGPAANGLTMLEPGQSLQRQVAFSVGP